MSITPRPDLATYRCCGLVQYAHRLRCCKCGKPFPFIPRPAPKDPPTKVPREKCNSGNLRGALAANLTRWRHWRKMTQEQLAEKAKTSRRTIISMETARRDVHTETFWNVARELAVSPLALLEPDPVLSACMGIPLPPPFRRRILEAVKGLAG